MSPASKNKAVGAQPHTPPSKTAHKMQRTFCKTIGITPRGIFIKQPTQIIAAKSAVKLVLKTDLFIKRIYQKTEEM